MISKVVRLVADPYPPYQFEEKGVLKGIDNEVITLAFKEHQIITRVKLFPWEDCIGLIKRKEADGIFQIVRSPEREKSLIFSKPLRTARTIFLKMVDADLVLSNDKDLKIQLKDYKIGVLAGYSYSDEIDNLSGPFKKEYQSQESLLIELSKGTLDLVIMDLGVASYLIDTMHFIGIVKVPGYEITRQLHVAFQNDYDDLVNIFNSGLDRIKEKGIYNKIYQKYAVPLYYIALPSTNSFYITMR
jgi:polar amino acid transport system substrate-binding protein